MTDSSEIAARAKFDIIRYAQLWEDGDILLDALGDQKNKKLVSICAAGDNALAMLLLDPKKVTAIDLSQAQLSCLRLRIAAFENLTHDEFIVLSGSRSSHARPEIFEKLLRHLPLEERKFWSARQKDVIAYGFGGVGKFERFFRIFHRRVLPLVQSQANIKSLLTPKTREARDRFMHDSWNNWRWRVMLKIFFSNFVMGRLGRDPAFFDHVEGQLSDHIARRLKHAMVDTDPSCNPYLNWVLRGNHSRTLPITWRAENFEIIRDRLDRLELRQGALEDFVASGEKADGYNLSDIFEYQSEEGFTKLYADILSSANKGARLVYWNMMVPRRCPNEYREHIERLVDVETQGKAKDKAFFYSDFVVEQVKS